LLINLSEKDTLNVKRIYTNTYAISISLSIKILTILKTAQNYCFLTQYWQHK